MSKQIAAIAADRLNLKECLISLQYTGLGRDLQQIAEADHTLEDEHALTIGRTNMMAAYGYGNEQSSEERKPFAFSQGVAIIPVHGTLLNRFSSSWGYATGYNFIRAQLSAAVADDDVELIVFDVNSFGGEAAGCFELCDDIYQARAAKPSLAVIDSNAYSSGYAIASSASKVLLTPSGGAGSIGVYVMHVNVGKMLSDSGYEVTFIQSGDKKTDGNPYESLSKEVKANIQANVDETREVFVNTVARNRGIDAKVVRDTEAACYRAEEALELGLVDMVAAPSQALAAFLEENELSGSEDNQQELNMSTATITKPGAKEATTPANEEAQAQVLATAKAEARAEEQARIKGITTSDEAKGKAALANHLALNTSMSVEDANGILKASAIEKAEPVAETNHLVAAMETVKTPALAAGGGDAAGDTTEPSNASRILAAQSSIRGAKTKA